MAEQETEEEKTEEKEEKEETEEEIFETTPKLYFRKDKERYLDKDFLEKLGEYYAQTLNYSETARMLNKEFKTEINSSTVKEIYIRKMAHKITHDKNASEFFDNSFKKMKERWQDAWDMVGDLIKQYKTIRDKIEEVDETKKAIMLLKLSPTIIQIAQEIRKQLEFIQTQQEQIKIQQQTLIYSPLQINQYIGPILKNLAEEGKIAVLKDSPEYGLNKKEKKK